MKILHINSYYSTSSFYKNLYDQQKRDGLDIDVYVPISTSIDVGMLSLGDYTTISVNHNKYDRLFFHIKHNKIYRDILNKYKIKEYSIIHAHSLFSNGYIAYKLNKKYNIPYIVAVRNTDINVFFKRMIHLRKLGVEILKNARKIIFISEPYREYTIDNYIPNKYKDNIKSKSIVIPNGIDKFWIGNKVVLKEIPAKKTISIIYVGAINSNKNIETTTKACEVLIKEGYAINYKIIGKITNDKYNNFINKHLFIEYVKHCSKEELIGYYRCADIFVMPSKHETFGLVYVEAMSQGLPVIYTRGQGFDAQFKEGEVGYSVEYDSENEIVEKIKYILNDYKTISENCLKNTNQFTWENIGIKYIEIYNQYI